MVVVVVDPHPSGPHSVVTAVKPVGPIVGAGQVDRRVGLAGGRLAEPHRVGGSDVGDGGHRGPRVGKAVKAAARGHPNLSG